MRKSILFGLTLLAVASAASIAQAGLFHRGGCPGGHCGVYQSAQYAEGPEVAQTEPAQPAAVEAAPGDEAVADASTSDSSYRRGGLFRGFFRRR